MEWYVPILIFFARIMDVSVGTLRIVSIMRGRKFTAAGLGFMETSIWLMAVSAVVLHVKDNWVAVVAYAGGYATGTMCGMILEEKLAIGMQLLRVVNIYPHRSVARFLRRRNIKVTEVEGAGASGRAEVLFFVVPRKRVKRIIAHILRYCPDAYITVEDVRSETTGSLLFTSAPNRPAFWRRIMKFR